MQPTLFRLAAVWVAAASLTAASPNDADRETERRIAEIKLPQGQRRWQEIPWVLDLAEGQRLAKVERRPIFLWVTGDDPLERC